jgi:hypothetical protein
MIRRSLRDLAMLLLGITACGDGTRSSDATTSMPDVNIAACGAIGTPCGTGCPSALECIGNACAPVRGDCGGFAGAQCQDTSLTCTYPTGNSAGICMRADEKACLCAIAPGVLGDCMAP